MTANVVKLVQPVPLPPERCANCISFNLRSQSPKGFCIRLQEDVPRGFHCILHARSIRPEPRYDAR